MRARYSAFVAGEAAFLLATWAPETRPADLALAQQPRWHRLEVLAHSAQGDRGEVRFRATGQEQAGWVQLEECSAFERRNGHWLYVNGTCTHTVLSPGRNDACPCGSGRKFKKCCGG